MQFCQRNNFGTTPCDGGVTYVETTSHLLTVYRKWIKGSRHLQHNWPEKDTYSLLRSVVLWKLWKLHSDIAIDELWPPNYMYMYLHGFVICCKIFIEK